MKHQRRNEKQARKQEKQKAKAAAQLIDIAQQRHLQR